MKLFSRKRFHFAMCFNTEPIADPTATPPAGNPDAAGSGAPASTPAPAPAPAPAPEVLPKYSDNTEMATFLEAYPELKESASLNKYKTVKELLEGHTELSGKIGNMVSLPKEDATDEEKAAAYDKIFKKLGKPENAEGYELSTEVPEGLVLNTELQTNFAKTAHELNLTKEQAQKLQAFHNDSLKAILDANNTNSAIAAETHVATQIAELKTAWGAEYKNRTQIAMNTAKAVLSPDTLSYLDKTGLGNNAKFIQDFYNLSKKFGGDGNHVKPENLNGETELMSIRAEATALRKDPTISRDPAKQARLKALTTRQAELTMEQVNR